MTNNCKTALTESTDDHAAGRKTSALWLRQESMTPLEELAPWRALSPELPST